MPYFVWFPKLILIPWFFYGPFLRKCLFFKFQIPRIIFEGSNFELEILKNKLKRWMLFQFLRTLSGSIVPNMKEKGYFWKDEKHLNMECDRRTNEHTYIGKTYILVYIYTYIGITEYALTLRAGVWKYHKITYSWEEKNWALPKCMLSLQTLLNASI